MTDYQIIGERKKGIFNPDLADKLVFDNKPPIVSDASAPPINTMPIQVIDNPSFIRLACNGATKNGSSEWDRYVPPKDKDGTEWNLASLADLYACFSNLKSKLSLDSNDDAALTMKNHLDKIFAWRVQSFYMNTRIDWEITPYPLNSNYQINNGNELFSIFDFEEPVLRPLDFLENYKMAREQFFFQKLFNTSDDITSIVDTIKFGFGSDKILVTAGQDILPTVSSRYVRLVKSFSKSFDTIYHEERIGYSSNLMSAIEVRKV
jgi:hypothetical protein